MADTVATFVAFFEHTPDPYPAPADRFEGFAANPAIQPATVLASATSETYPMGFLVASSEHRPLPVVSLYTRNTLPGAAPPTDKLGFVGDVSTGGVPPSMVSITNGSFHLTANSHVLDAQQFVDAWANLAPGEQFLASQVAGAADTAEVRTRKAIPIPHEYTGQILTAYSQGVLSWRWIVANVVAPIAADPQQLADYESFLDYVRVASTNRPGVNPGDPDQFPETELAYGALLTTPPVQEQALQVCRRYLPGLRQPVGVEAQLGQLNQQNLQMQQTMANAAAPRIATLASKYPGIFPQILRANEVPDETQLAPYWPVMVDVRSSAWLGTMEAVCQTIAYDRGLMCPMLLPGHVSDISSGRLTAPVNSVTSGLASWARVRPENDPNVEELYDQNRVYTMMVQGTGAVQTDAVSMTLANREVHPPKNEGEFRGIVEGLYVLWLAVLGEHNRMVQNFEVQIIANLNDLIRRLASFYPDESSRLTEYIRILCFISLSANGYLIKLTRGPAPITLGVPAAGVGPPPDFLVIDEKLGYNALFTLGEIPPGILRPTVRQSLTQTPNGDAGAETPGGEETPTRQRVENLQQNSNLKAAWRASGHSSIFGSGSPFRDESKPNNKVVIMSDVPGKRLCLAMACNGVCSSNCRGKHGVLSAAEVQRIASHAGLTGHGL